MSTLTKEWLQQKIADMEATRDDIPFGLGEDGTNTLAALRIALASLEAEPVAYMHRSGQVVTREGCCDDKTFAICCKVETPLYTAPPAPVSVPDESAVELLATDLMKRIDKITGERHSVATLSSLRVSIVEACRAAMLHGADTELQRKAAIHDALCEKYNVESLSDFVDWQRNHIAELEAAPPAPVAEGETAVVPDYPGYVMTQRECYQAGVKVGMERSAPVLQVWYGAMPETNGKTNWTAILHRKGDHLWEGITIDRSEYPDRVRYEADRMRHLIGELADEPDILAYDAEAHSGYIYPGNSPVIQDGLCPRCGRKPLKNKTCSVAGCDGKHVARGFCAMHYAIERKKDPSRLDSIRAADKRYRARKAAAPQQEEKNV